jgi:hypothetical protein
MKQVVTVSNKLLENKALINVRPSYQRWHARFPNCDKEDYISLSMPGTKQQGPFFVLSRHLRSTYSSVRFLSWLKTASAGGVITLPQ